MTASARHVTLLTESPRGGMYAQISPSVCDYTVPAPTCWFGLNACTGEITPRGQIKRWNLPFELCWFMYAQISPSVCDYTLPVPTCWIGLNACTGEITPRGQIKRWNFPLSFVGLWFPENESYLLSVRSWLSFRVHSSCSGRDNATRSDNSAHRSPRPPLLVTTADNQDAYSGVIRRSQLPFLSYGSIGKVILTHYISEYSDICYLFTRSFRWYIRERNLLSQHQSFLQLVTVPRFQVTVLCY